MIAAVKLPGVFVFAGPVAGDTSGPEVASVTVAGTVAPKTPSVNTGAGVTQVSVGAVASRFTKADALAVPPSDVASHVNEISAVSDVTLVGSQPVCEMISDSGSCTSKLTATSETYQPLSPIVPDTVGVITGGQSRGPTGRQSQMPV